MVVAQAPWWQQVLERAVALGASDVHVAVGLPIFFRLYGTLVPQTQEMVTAVLAEEFARGMMSEQAFARFTERKEIDVSYQVASGARLRVNCAFEKQQITISARVIPQLIPSLADLDLEQIAQRFCTLQSGLVLFTGPTGTGKSTSLASLLHSINQQRPVNIVTLEDPIEFLFPRGQGLVRQRQYLHDFHSFEEALKHILRQDPDIVMVGEMRDPETIAAALTLAETGHLIFGTLHTPNSYQSVDRIIDVFPPHQQNQIRSQLSLTLRGVVSQRLLPRAGGGRIAQREIMVNNTAVANIIRESRLQELPSVIQTGIAEGMQSFDQHAAELLEKGLIEQEVHDMILGA